MTVEEFLSRLENVRGSAPLWTARCPAHEDRNASLSVREGDDGRTLVYCHTGCDRADIVAATGLSMSDLFVESAERPEPVQRAEEPPAPPPSQDKVEGWVERLQSNPRSLARLGELKGWTPAALSALNVGFDGSRLTLPVYSDGEPVGVRRYAPGGQPKMLAPKGTPRDLWPCPEDFCASEPLLLVEGEPDAISALSLGVSACALPGAALWREDWPARFAGRRVVVMLDCDEPGRKAAARAAAELSAATWVRRVDLAPDRNDGFDLGDLLLAQREKGQLDLLQRRLRQLLEG